MLATCKECVILWLLFLLYSITVSLVNCLTIYDLHQWWSKFVLTVIVLFSEVITYSCFVDLMQRMNNNFPHGGAMDTHFANMRSLIQVREFLKKNSLLTSKDMLIKKERKKERT